MQGEQEKLSSGLGDLIVTVEATLGWKEGPFGLIYVRSWSFPHCER